MVEDAFAKLTLGMLPMLHVTTGTGATKFLQQGGSGHFPTPFASTG